jgi:hypothetical protein
MLLAYEINEMKILCWLDGFVMNWKRPTEWVLKAKANELNLVVNCLSVSMDVT